MALGKLLVLVGVLALGAGLLLWWGVPVGKLPGDFVIRRGSFTFYFPLTTSVLISLAVTVILTIARR